MDKLPIRKYLRLQGYDYNQNGAYFITICVNDKHEMLGEVVGRDALGTPYIKLSEYGEIVFKEIEKTPSYYNGITIDKFVVMPNHVHMIITINRNYDSTTINEIKNNGAPRASRPTTALIPNIIAILKKKTNKIFSFNMWQDSYHDRIIRSEKEYQAICKYIDENPAQWAEDEYYEEK